MDRYDEALATCERAVALRPDRATVWASRGTINKGDGPLSGGSCGFRYGIRLKPAFALAGLLDTYIWSGTRRH